MVKRRINNLPSLSGLDGSDNIFSASEISITYRHKVIPSSMPKLSRSQDTVIVLRKIWSDRLEHVEEFVVICLNRANRMLGWAKISSGGLSGTVADPKVIFQIALKSNASSIILAHNHPSGNLQPSEMDIRLTRKNKEAGLVLDLQVIDHIILTSEGYYSFADEGTLRTINEN
jgi:DNA repair protein RadC